MSYRLFRPFIFGIFSIAACWFAPSCVKRLAYETFYEFEAPSLVLASHVKDLSRYWEMRSRGKHELIESGRDAARIAGTLRFETQQLGELRDENRRLESLLALPSRPEMRTVVARVAQRNLGLWWQQIVIRRGRVDGIRAGCPVVNAQGVVGRVREVHTYTSVVELVSSRSFRISAYIEGSNYPVTFCGAGGSPFGKSFGVLQDIPSDFPANLPDGVPVVTTGVGGVFPAGFRIGTFDGKMRLSDDGLFYLANVNLRADLAAIEEVAVLVPVSADVTEYNEWER